MAKNAVGLSEPSDPSPLVTISPPEGKPETKPPEAKRQISIPLVDEMVRESPPLPDRDGQFL